MMPGLILRLPRAECAERARDGDAACGSGWRERLTHRPGRAVGRRAAAGGAGPGAAAAAAPAARPTSRPATSTPRPAARCTSCSSSSTASCGMTMLHRHPQRRAGGQDAPPAAHGRRPDRRAASDASGRDGLPVAGRRLGRLALASRCRCSLACRSLARGRPRARRGRPRRAAGARRRRRPTGRTPRRRAGRADAGRLAACGSPSCSSAATARSRTTPSRSTCKTVAGRDADPGDAARGRPRDLEDGLLRRRPGRGDGRPGRRAAS